MQNNKSNGLNFVFFGTPDVASETLEILKQNGFMPSLIVTSPDARKGRGLHVEASPVAIFAEKNNIPCLKLNKPPPPLHPPPPTGGGGGGGGVFFFFFFCRKKKIKKEDGLIDLEDNAVKNYNKFRAYAHWPRTFFFKDGKRIIITKAKLENDKFIIEKILPEGKKETKYEDFLKN